MPKVGVINIIGGIGSDPFSEVNLRMVMEQVERAGDVEEYLVNINSRGGEVSEGYAIYNYITGLKKPVTTRGVGIVASIATVIFLAGANRELYGSTQFLIHNPWTFSEGDADTLTKKAEELKSIEDTLVEFYVRHTGFDKDALTSLMKEDKLIPASEAKEMNFATKVLDTEKAYAKYKNTKTSKNHMAHIGKIFKDAFKALRQHGVVLNEKVMTQDGKELEIEMEGDSIAVGDSVMLDGQPADGSFELADGTTIMVSNGKITEVEKPSAEASIVNATKADLTQQIEDLTARLDAALTEVETLKAERSQMVEEVATITNHLRSIKTSVELPKNVATFNRLSKDQVKNEPTSEEVKARIKELQAKSRKKVTIAI
jgi:ATP-dependent Clp protease protease subunit